MRPLLTRRKIDPGAAEQATPAGGPPVSESDRDATRVTAEIQAPPPTGPPQRPAPMPPPDPLAAASAGPAERGKLRRRLRRLKRVRHKQLAELGLLVVDARKHANGSRPEVLERRAAEAAEVDRQVRELQHAVDAHADRRELATGVAGTCRSCGDLLSTEDRFCPACGTPTSALRRRPVHDRVADTAESAAVAPDMPAAPAPAPLPPPPAGARPATPPPPPANAPLAHVDPATIPPPPPPPPA
jgi:hypothetical protein